MHKPTFFTLLLIVALALQSCGSQDDASESAAEAPAAPAAPAQMTRTPATPGASVFFITPTDGATTSSPVTVKFGISGMSVVPAGNSTPDSGHHHLLIDVELADPSLPVPSDSNHLHFGKGQTETELELAPGQHRLQLILGDANHVPHDPPVMSDPITITVE